MTDFELFERWVSAYDWDDLKIADSGRLVQAGALYLNKDGTNITIEGITQRPNTQGDPMDGMDDMDNFRSAGTLINMSNAFAWRLLNQLAGILGATVNVLS